MENKHHQFIAQLPVTLEKHGGVAICIRVEAGDFYAIYRVTDDKVQAELNEFIIRARKVKALFDGDAS